jgi:hypothetical protein
MADTLKMLTTLDLGSICYALGDVLTHEDKCCLLMAAGACSMRFDPAPRSVSVAQTKRCLVNSTARDAREVARERTPIGRMHVPKQRLAQNESRVTSQDCSKGRAGIADLAVRGGENNKCRWLCADEVPQPGSGLERGLAPSEETVNCCAEHETDA